MGLDIAPLEAHYFSGLTKQMKSTEEIDSAKTSPL